jgi:hypothetical protein
MLSKEIAEKIKEELSSFFGIELASFVLYGSYAGGKETKYSDLRNFNPLLLNILKHGIPLLDDGTFATVKDEFQRMIDRVENTRTARGLLGGGCSMNTVFELLTKFMKENYNEEKKEAEHWSRAI